MENPADDLHDVLTSAFEQAEKQEAPVQGSVTQAEPALVAGVVSEGRARDEQGRFAKQEQQVEMPAAVAAEPVPTRKAPSSWKPEAQTAFLKADRGEALTPEEVVLLTREAERRESDYHKGIEQYKQHAQTAQAFQRVVEPYMQTIQSLGVDAPTAVAKLFHADHTLRYGDAATKARFLGQLAQEYGVDLGQVVNQPQMDPQVSAVLQRLQMTEQQLNQFRQEQEMQSQSKLHSEIERFASDPANVHFDAVKEDMALLLQTGKAEDLKSAYDQAVWMRSDIRQSLIEQQRAEAQKQAMEQAQNARAKAAAGSVKGSSPAGAGVQPVKGSLRDQLSAAFEASD